MLFTCMWIEISILILNYENDFSFMVRYMKYYCNSTLSWGEDGTGDHINVPLPLPRVSSVWKQEVCKME